MYGTIVKNTLVEIMSKIDLTTFTKIILVKSLLSSENLFYQNRYQDKAYYSIKIITFTKLIPAKWIHS